jgi:hypothetical protein
MWAQVSMAIIIPAPTTGGCIRGMDPLMAGPIIRSQDTIMATIKAIAMDISTVFMMDTITEPGPLIVTDLTDLIDLIDLTGIDSGASSPRLWF